MPVSDRDVGSIAAQSVHGARGGIAQSVTAAAWTTVDVTAYAGGYLKAVADGATGFWFIFSSDPTPGTAVDQTATSATFLATIPDYQPEGLPMMEVVPEPGPGETVSLHLRCKDATSIIRIRPA